MKNGGALFRTGSNRDWHGMSRLTPVYTRIMAVLLRLGPVAPRCASIYQGLFGIMVPLPRFILESMQSQNYISLVVVYKDYT